MHLSANSQRAGLTGTSRSSATRNSVVVNFRTRLHKFPNSRAQLIHATTDLGSVPMRVRLAGFPCPQQLGRYIVVMPRPRTYPFRPKSTVNLRIGDLLEVHREDGRWGCLQVTDLKESGTGARTSLVVGVLPWVGDCPPTSADVAGMAVIEQGLAHIDIFAEGGLMVVGHCDVVPSGLDSNYRDFHVGSHHRVWGWRVAVSRSQRLIP